MTGRTEIRIEEIRRRTRRKRQTAEVRRIACLSSGSLALSAGIGALLQNVQASDVAVVNMGYSSVLLRQGAGAYVVVGIAAFVVGVVFTVVCIRLHRKSREPDESAQEP